MPLFWLGANSPRFAGIQGAGGSRAMKPRSWSQHGAHGCPRHSLWGWPPHHGSAQLARCPRSHLKKTLSQKLKPQTFWGSCKRASVDGFWVLRPSVYISTWRDGGFQLPSHPSCRETFALQAVLQTALWIGSRHKAAPSRSTARRCE